MIKWDKEDNGLWLFTERELEQLPDGTELRSIGGSIAVKGKDYIDLDTRGGHIAFGVVDPFNHPLKDMFLLFIIAGRK